MFSAVLREKARKVARASAVFFLLIFTFALVDAWEALGARPDAARLTRMKRSPNFVDGKFVNPEPLVNDWWLGAASVFEISAHTSPHGDLPVVKRSAADFAVAPRSGLRATWLGHSTMLVEIDGHRVLTDPMWSERSSPLTWIGPKRWFAPPIALAELPPIDAVVISHDHYDHLDHGTIVAMKDWDTTFVVPLGVGAHLEYWGVPKAHIVELDWWERTKVKGIEVVCTPARHASGRMVFDDDATLWAGFALLGTQHRVYYSGDTGLFSAMRDIGERLGPFDLTLIESGQYHRAWPDWHIGPEQAVLAHQVLRGRVMLPVHWSALALAYHGWTEPIERVLAAADKAGVKVLTPRPGESVEPEIAPATARWWPKLPFQTAQENPVVSTKVSTASLLAPSSHDTALDRTPSPMQTNAPRGRDHDDEAEPAKPWTRSAQRW